MKSLTDYFFEDEDKFVSIEYKTTTDDDVQLAGAVWDEFSHNEEGSKDNPNLPGGADLKLVGEVRLYSETSSIFKDRKRKIAQVFKAKLKDEEINANRIKYTKIFDYYINHLITYYKKNVDENCKLNVSSKDELRRQIADDFVLLIKNMEILPTI